MSANFFKINRGITLDPQAEYGGGDPAGTDGDIYYNEVLDRFRIFQAGAWQDLGSGSGPNNSRAGEAPISSNATSITVTFSTPVTSPVYDVLVDMVNLVDPDPQYQQVIVTNKTVNGFTVQWNAPTDSGNYAIDYIVAGNVAAMGEAVVPFGADSLTVTLNIPFSSTSYTVMAMLQDVTDPFPQFMTVVVTNKTNSTFTVEWNDGVDSSNYVISYQAMGYA